MELRPVGGELVIIAGAAMSFNIAGVFKYDADQGGYVVPITEEFLALAPKLDVSDLSGWDDSQQREALHKYYALYGARPYWYGLP